MVYGLGLVLSAGLIPEWGRWFSCNVHYRLQVQALLRGQLALSHDPAALTHDLAWSEGGVHQVWGLGVPLWRLPFELAARLVGAPAFPDMLVLAAALGLAAWVVLSAFQLYASSEESLPKGVRLALGVCQAGAVGLLLLFPPFLNLFPSRFEIYEEAIAYEYLVGLGLNSGLVALTTRPKVSRYWGLCALAGLGGLVRPTLVFHGMAMVVVATLVWWLRARQVSNLSAHPQPDATAGSVGPMSGAGLLGPGADAASAARSVPSVSASAGPRLQRWAGGRRLLGSVAIGLMLFGAGGGLLYVTNLLRFGSGFEFGHKLNVQSLYSSLYTTRFDYPFQDEPFWSAARELFGWLFLKPNLHSWGFHAPGVVRGQSPTVRWREAYLTTYDLSYLVGILAGWAAGAGAVWRLGRRRSKGWAGEQGVTGAWVVAALAVYSLLAAVPLLGFYVRNGVITSRYMLDFAPTFVAAMLAGWLGWGRCCQRLRGAGWCMGLSLVVGLCWWGWQVYESRSAYGAPRVCRWSAVQDRLKDFQARTSQFPQSGCYSDPKAPAATGIRFYNGAGWKAEQGGRLMPCVILFVDDPEFLELELEPVAEVAGRVPADPAQIRAKVGLEFLRRERIDRTAKGWRVRFSGPRQKRYQRGVQPVFLATVPKEFLADDDNAPWRLVQVRWRAPKPDAGGQSSELP
jgi:hypothetical protein